MRIMITCFPRILRLCCRGSFQKFWPSVLGCTQGQNIDVLKQLFWILVHRGSGGMLSKSALAKSFPFITACHGKSPRLLFLQFVERESSSAVEKL
jgi:hypothetical protein